MNIIVYIIYNRMIKCLKFSVVIQYSNTDILYKNTRKKCDIIIVCQHKLKRLYQNTTMMYK